MGKRRSDRILRFFAIFAIYLIISVTFFTARAFAILNYDIRGEGGASGFAKSDNDIVTFYVNATGNVSFDSGTLGAIPITDCDSTGSSMNCMQQLGPVSVDEGIESIPFLLTQSEGVPSTKSGVLYIDRAAPDSELLDVNRSGTGLKFTYIFRDYLTNESEQDACKGSGVGVVAIQFQGKEVYRQTATTNNCTLSGSYYLDLTGKRIDSASYSVLATDRAGNEYSSGSIVLKDDFKPPMIGDTFKIMRNGEEVTKVSTAAEVTADIVVEVEDKNLSVVYGNISGVNVNPRVYMDPDYQQAQADCVVGSGDVYICTFKDVRIRPAGNSIEIVITAMDKDENTAVKSLKKVMSVLDTAGQVLYIGPPKDQCTSDLSKCYTRSGRQVLFAELDSTSSYAKGIINLGINSDRTFSVCRLNNTWKCTSVYNIDADSDLYIAESYDDYGNMIESSLERTLYVDDTPPKNVSALLAKNSNNNNNCSVSLDELEFRINISEDTPELKMYVNTSEFTSQKIQRGACERSESGYYECILTVKGFSSIESSKVQNIVFEDLAGNPLPIPYKFDVCRSSSDKAPNVISSVEQTLTPKIDRKTANKISVKTYIPVSIKVDPRATLMYLNVERCVAIGNDGLNVMGTGHTFIPQYGNNPTLTLYIGHSGAMLPENNLQINCTLSARVKVGRTVYMQEERQDFIVTVSTYVNELGSIDKSTIEEINDVKDNLRDLDKKIKGWEGTIGYLGKICSLAETLGRINSAIQTVRVVLYGVLIVLSAIPQLTTACQNIWKAVYVPTQFLHTSITKYVWPPGIIPGKGDSISFGTVVKWICLLYTCKHYDAGTYIQITQELFARWEKTNKNEPTAEAYGEQPGDTDATYMDAEGNVQKGVKTDTAGNKVDAKGNLLVPGKDASGKAIVTKDNKPILVPANANGDPVDSSGRLVVRDNTGKVTGYGKYTPEGNVEALKPGEPMKLSKDTPLYERDATGNIKKEGGKAVVKTDPNTAKPLKAGTQGQPFDIAAGQTSAETTKVSGTKTIKMSDSESWPEKTQGSEADFSNTYTEYEAVTFSEADIKFSAQSINAQREMLLNALNGHSWIIDPYKSVHYDGLCIPAYIYNLKKERQIDCMYLYCLEGQKGVAAPKIMCDGNYKVNKCLYLDSADYVLSGSHFMKSFVKGLWDSFENTAPAIAIGIGYKKLCPQDYQPSKVLQKMSLTKDGWRTSTCGVLGALMGARELADTMKNKFAMPPILKDGRSYGEVDYCALVDYKNDYADTGGAGWFDE